MALFYYNERTFHAHETVQS